MCTSFVPVKLVWLVSPGRVGSLSVMSMSSSNGEEWGWEGEGEEERDGRCEWVELTREKVLLVVDGGRGGREDCVCMCAGEEGGGGGEGRE